MSTVTMSQPISAEAMRPAWRAPVRAGFRFCFLYFLLYCLFTQIINSVLIIPKVDLPDWGTLRPFRDAVFWMGAHIFRLKTPLTYQGSGSGDKQYDWVLLVCMLGTALIVTAVWTALDHRRREHVTLQSWFLLFLRICLGSQMIIYGMVKIIPLQMPYPSLFQLVERFGDFSPMGVLWGATGASPAYERFAGFAELSGALLLMFPRTVTLGALVCLADMTQVFVLNMTYDVPVKLLSFHLILIALLVLGPDLRRLWDFLVLNRATETAKRITLFAGKRAQRITAAVVAFLWVWMLGNNVYGTWKTWHEYGPGREKSALYGIWDIEEYSLDGEPRPLVITESKEWRSLVFDFPQYARVLLMDGSRGYEVRIDTKASTVMLIDRRNSWHTQFSYARPSFDHLTLDGTMDGHKATFHLTRVDEKKLMLESRGFHWVQDYPFNR